MKWNKATLTSLAILIAAAALYRVFPGRPYGFAPQLAMALFGGAVIRDLKWSFALPLFSMFLSDALYQGLYVAGISPIKGFYSGQWLNYLELASVVCIGFAMRNITIPRFIVGSLLAPTWFFLLSNFTVWAAGTGTFIPKTFTDLLETYTLGLPFYLNSIAATFFFGAVFFGAWYYWLAKKPSATAA